MVCLELQRRGNIPQSMFVLWPRCLPQPRLAGRGRPSQGPTMPRSQPGAPAALRAVNHALASAILLLLIISVGVLVLPVTLQIFSRYTAFIPSYIWTEEMARFCLVYSVMLGAMLAVREGTHFTVDVFPRLSPRGEAKVELLAGVFVLI